MNTLQYVFEQINKFHASYIQNNPKFFDLWSGWNKCKEIFGSEELFSNLTIREVEIICESIYVSYMSSISLPHDTLKRDLFGGENVRRHIRSLLTIQDCTPDQYCHFDRNNPENPVNKAIELFWITALVMKRFVMEGEITYHNGRGYWYDANGAWTTPMELKIRLKNVNLEDSSVYY